MPPWLGYPLQIIRVTNDYGYVPLIVIPAFPQSWLTTGFLTTVTRRAPLVEHDFLILPKLMSALRLFSVLTVCNFLHSWFEDRCPLSLLFWPLSVFSSIDDFWCSLWCLQTFLKELKYVLVLRFITLLLRIL